MMVRVTVLDPERTVSFVVTPEAVPRLVAGCCANPASLADLLLSVEAFQAGITRLVFDALMEFDKEVARAGMDAVVATLAQGAGRGDTFEVTFEAISPALDALARRSSRTSPLVLIDLVSKVIDQSPGFSLARSGTIQVHDGAVLTSQSVTYSLPPEWIIGAAA